VLRIIQFLNYFLMEKLRVPGPPLMDHGGAGPRWTLDKGSAMISLEFSLTAALGHGGLPAMAQLRERSTGSPSRASPGHGQWHDGRVTAVKKWRWRHSVRLALEQGDKRRRTWRDAVEDGEAGAVLTQSREEVRRPGDDDKAAAVEELGGGGTRSQRGEEDSKDGCGEERVRASASYRGWREAEAARIGRAVALNGVLNGAVTRVGGVRKCG
jgi:hypothetical protein